MVRKALKALPKEFRQKLQNIDVVIEDTVDPGTVRSMGLRGRSELLGLYQGVPLKDRTQSYDLVMPDKITLYKSNIEAACEEEGKDIYEEVKHVVRHEIAHHFGISDRRMEDLDVY